MNGDSPSAAAFREATGALLGQLGQGPGEAAAPRAANLEDLGDTILAGVDPRRTIAESYRSRLHLAPGLTGEREDPLEPVRVGPEFPQPMYAALRDLSQDWLLPGLDKVPANTVSLLVTNQRMIEAFMVGLNHEMARECTWNEFPFTDWRWTSFRQFWDPAGAVAPPGQTVDPETLKDIEPIHTWRRLGANTSRRLQESADHLVLLVRGELLRRYPNALVYAVKARWVQAGGEAEGKRGLTDPPVERHPVFSGTLKPDVAFFGFDLSGDAARGHTDPALDQGWYFMFEEHLSEPRFGFDSAPTHRQEIGGAPEAWRDLSWGHLAANEEDLAALTYVDLDAGLPDTSRIEGGPDVRWGRTAADMAYITLQRPVRLAVHASDMLPPP